MHVKSTNKVRRNNRRKMINNLVTGTLNSYGEASIENLMDQVSNRSNRQIPQIYSAVKRTLRCGIRNGFIVKHDNKFSLSDRHYEIDSSRYIDKARTKFATYDKEIENCENIFINCKTSEDCIRCEAKDLVTLNRCDYEKSESGNYCLVHLQLLDLLEYKRLFFDNYETITGSVGFQQKIDSNVRDRLEANCFLQFSLTEYRTFLQKYQQYIFGGEQIDTGITSLIESILNGVYIDYDECSCNGIDISIGEQCTYEPYETNSYCQHHFNLHTFMKMFSHFAQKGCGFDGEVIDEVYETLTNNCLDEEFKNKIKKMDLHIKLYASLMTRYEDLAISRVKDNL